MSAAEVFVLAVVVAETAYGVYCLLRTSFTGKPTTWWLVPGLGVEFYQK